MEAYIEYSEMGFNLKIFMDKEKFYSRIENLFQKRFLLDHLYVPAYLE